MREKFSRTGGDWNIWRAKPMRRGFFAEISNLPKTNSPVEMTFLPSLGREPIFRRESNSGKARHVGRTPGSGSPMAGQEHFGRRFARRTRREVRRISECPRY